MSNVQLCDHGVSQGLSGNSAQCGDTVNDALSYIVERGDLGALRSALEKHVESSALQGALREAVCRGSLQFVNELVAHGASVADQDDETGWTLLHFAVEHGQLEMAESLVALGVEINKGDRSGATALHLAVDVEADGARQDGDVPRVSMIRLLLRLGADSGLKDGVGETPLDWALEAGFSDAVSLLS